MTRLPLRPALAAFCLLLAAAAPPPAPVPAATPAVAAAMLRGLDKTTGKVTSFTAPIGRTVTFGTLQVTVKDCRKHPPEDAPETAAFLDIVEALPGEAPKALFSGWMFASSPALSALEHPVYDVWVLDCSTPSGSSKSG